MDKKKIALVSAGAIILAVSGYFAYRGIKKWIENRQDDDNNNTPKPDNQIPSPLALLTPTENPFSSKDELLAFQQWVINTKGDKSILGSGGASGFGDDGKWGKKSAKAWDKYGADYKKVSNTAPATTSFDFITLKSLLNNFEKPVNSENKLQIATSTEQPRILIDFYKDGTMVVQKDKAWIPVYDKTNGKWSVLNNKATLTLSGKSAIITQSDNNGIWSLLKQTNYLNAQNGQFVPFNEEPKKKRNRTQLDMGCEDLM
jgi:hypothetical protein